MNEHASASLPLWDFKCSHPLLFVQGTILEVFDDGVFVLLTFDILDIKFYFLFYNLSRIGGHLKLSDSTLQIADLLTEQAGVGGSILGRHHGEGGSSLSVTGHVDFELWDQGLESRWWGSDPTGVEWSSLVRVDLFDIT